jgi:molybdate/tungstate transport system substrate-binding protein
MGAYYTRPVRLRATPFSVALGLVGCAGPRSEAAKPPITIFAAASLARPLTQLTHSFENRSRVSALVELGGSLEHARKLTELGRTPDVLMLADDEVIASLAPTHIDWYVRVATTRLVVAYTARSRYAREIGAEDWWRILSRRDVTVGRADPSIAPAGRHAVALLRRAETYYQEPRLADRLLGQASLKYVRPNATELAALLETGEVDYILDYESVARQYGFRFITLPEDLAVRVLYGVSVPRNAAHPAEAVDFIAYLLSQDGKRILRDANFDVLSVPVAIGTGIPSEITDLVRTSTPSAAR